MASASRLSSGISLASKLKSDPFGLRISDLQKRLVLSWRSLANYSKATNQSISFSSTLSRTNQPRPNQNQTTSLPFLLHPLCYDRTLLRQIGRASCDPILCGLATCTKAKTCWVPSRKPFSRIFRCFKQRDNNSSNSKELLW